MTHVIRGHCIVWRMNPLSSYSLVVPFQLIKISKFILTVKIITYKKNWAIKNKELLFW
jgi:hypothetical protein